MEAAPTPMTTRQKAKKLGLALGSAGVEATGSILSGRESSKEQRKKATADLVEMSEAGLSGRSELGRVAMGLPPTMEEESVPMKSAMDLIQSPYKPSLGTDDISSMKSTMGKEVASGLGQFERTPQNPTGRNAAELDKIKRKLGWKKGKDNPELYPKGGAGGTEDFSSSLLGQLNKSKPPLRGGKYES